MVQPVRRLQLLCPVVASQRVDEIAWSLLRARASVSNGMRQYKLFAYSLLSSALVRRNPP